MSNNERFSITPTDDANGWAIAGAINSFVAIIITMSWLYIGINKHGDFKNPWPNLGLSFSINEWLIFGLSIIAIINMLSYLGYRAYQIRKVSPTNRSWANALAELNEKYKDIRNAKNVGYYLWINDPHVKLKRTTATHINNLFMPNQKYIKAFGSFLIIMVIQIWNSIMFVINVNALIVAPIQLKYGLYVLILAIFTGTFVFSGRDKPQWLKYLLMAIQFGCIVALMLALLL